jgi:hypothetical protein
MRRYLISPFVSAVVLASALLAPLSQAQSINPNHVYLYKGELVQRSIALGDPANWNTNLTGREGKSAGGKVEVSPADFKSKGDAIQIKWSPRKKVVGSFVIAGEVIDLSKLKDTASLTIDMKVDVKPDKDVKVGMSCDYPCLANVSINNMIKPMPKGEWFSLPIPLNCFVGDDFDLAKISGPFTIATDGKFTVSITNIRLEKLAEGDKGCAGEKKE